MRPLTAHQTFSRALGRGLHAPRLPCQLCPGAFSLGEGDLHPQLPALEACDSRRLKSLRFFEPVTTAFAPGRRAWQCYAVAAGIAGGVAAAFWGRLAAFREAFTGAFFTAFLAAGACWALAAVAAVDNRTEPRT